LRSLATPFKSSLAADLPSVLILILTSFGPDIAGFPTGFSSAHEKALYTGLSA
jgi:hypothetical protein